MSLDLASASSSGHGSRLNGLLSTSLGLQTYLMEICLERSAGSGQIISESRSSPLAQSSPSRLSPLSHLYSSLPRMATAASR